MTVLRLLLLAALVVGVPMALPAVWVGDGLVPDLALLAVLYLAIHGTPDRAALLGVALGAAVLPFTVAPLGLTSFLLGTAGWVIGQLAKSLERDRLAVQCALVFAAVVTVRAAGLLAVTTQRAADADIPSVALGSAASAVVLGAATSALAAPFAMALLERSRLLRSLEVRRRRRV